MRLPRLIDSTPGGDADEALLGRLMRSVGPLPESEVARRRVRRAVQDRTAQPAPRRFASRPGLRTAMGATALLVIGGIAGATVGRAAWDRVFPATPAVVPASPVSPAIPSQPVVSPVTAAPTAIETAPATAPSAIPAPAAAARPVSVEEQRARKRTMAVAAPMPATEPAVAPSAPVEVESSELTRLLERARFELTSAKGDPARARVLAEDYLSKAPKGMSVEDAMYLACLAAARNGDADATQLARRYLERFPAGNFAAVVRPMAAATESTR